MDYFGILCHRHAFATKHSLCGQEYKINIVALELHEFLILLLSGKIKGVSPVRVAQQVQLYFSSAGLKYLLFCIFVVLCSDIR